MSAVIGHNKVVLIHYTLRNEAKEVLDSSSGSDPLPYLHGHGNIITGLEGALEGRKEGEKISVTVEPQQGYGEYDARLLREIERSRFPEDAALEVGSSFAASGPDGESIEIRVIELKGDNVVIDGNHPLAGVKLFFEVEVVTIREATPSEIEHGHAHPGDGHHH